MPLSLLILPPYALALLLTIRTSNEFACIAWAGGGVSTGPITVPLVTSLGLARSAAAPAAAAGPPTPRA